MPEKAEAREVENATRITIIEKNTEKISEAIIELKSISVKQTYLAEEIVRLNKRVDGALDNLDKLENETSDDIVKFNTFLKTGAWIFGILQVVIAMAYGGYVSTITKLQDVTALTDKRLNLIEYQTRKHLEDYGKMKDNSYGGRR